jgi:hypothetical protein
MTSARKRLGDGIVAEKKTTNFWLTPVQKALS